MVTCLGADFQVSDPSGFDGLLYSLQLYLSTLLQVAFVPEKDQLYVGDGVFVDLDSLECTYLNQ